MERPSPTPSASLKADAVLLLLTAVWGSTFLVVKGSLSRADPFSFLALRFLLGAIVATLLAGRRLAHAPSVRAGLVLAPFLFLGFILQTVGLRYTTASRSAFFTGLSMVLVPFLAIAIERTWPRAPSLVGVVLSAIGVYLLGGGADAGNAPTLVGDLLTLGCAVAYALQIALTGRLAARSRVTAMVAVQLWGVALLSLLCLPFVERRVEWGWSLLGGVAFTGLFASALAINLQSWGQARTTAVRAALIFSAEPVFAAVYSALLTGERFSRGELLGGACIVLGILASEVGTAVLDRLRAGASAQGAA